MLITIIPLFFFSSQKDEYSDDDLNIDVSKSNTNKKGKQINIFGDDDDEEDMEQDAGSDENSSSSEEDDGDESSDDEVNYSMFIWKNNFLMELSTFGNPFNYS